MGNLYQQHIGRSKRNNDGLRDYQREALRKVEEMLFRQEKDITDQVEIISEPKLLTGGDVSAEFNGIEVE